VPIAIDRSAGREDGPLANLHLLAPVAAAREMAVE
jgi:hypothetical protein